MSKNKAAQALAAGESTSAWRQPMTTQTGRTATEMTRDKAMQAIIRAQPGYRRGATMRVMRTAQRKAYRLYVDVEGRWMDGSLEDMVIRPASARGES